MENLILFLKKEKKNFKIEKDFYFQKRYSLILFKEVQGQVLIENKFRFKIK